MKQYNVKKITSHISRITPGSMVKGRLVYMHPVGQLLRGYYVDDSRSQDQAYIWIFVQPMFVPCEFLAFNIGERLGGSNRTWSTTEMTELTRVILEDGAVWLRKYERVEDVCLCSDLRARRDEFSAQAVAYSCFLAGREEDAIRRLKVIEKMAIGDLQWVVDIRNRSVLMASLIQSNPAAARTQLREWESYTLSHIGIPP